MSAPARPRIPTPGDLARSTGAPNAPVPVAAPDHARAPEPVTATTPARTSHEEEAPPQQPLYEPRSLTAEEAIAPGVLADTEHFRRTFRYAITCSNLPPHARLVAYDLLFRARHENGRIGSSHQPDTRHLAKATGLSEMQTGVALQVLHTRGWIVFRPATTHPDGSTRRRLYDLAIPALVLEQARARRHLHRQ